MIDPTTELEATEAYKTLVAQVGRKSPTIPAGLLARHVLGIVPAEEWPTRVAALDALLRRLESAHRDELRIVARPKGGRALGPYATKRKGSEVRPYRTVLSGVDPLEGSCDCPDFLKNSLGLCKHLLTVLEALYEKPRRLTQANREQANRGDRTGLVWDPIRPLMGLGDWLDRVAWQGDLATRSTASEQRTRALGRFRRGGDEPHSLKQTFPDDPAKRLALVEDLRSLLPARRENRNEPALRALLANERDRLKRIVEQAPSASEVRAALRGLKRPLYHYQREGVERFLARGRLLLADDMGLGKTAQAIASTEVLCRTGRVQRGLVIAPASLKPQWAREWATFSELPIEVIEGTPADRQAVYETHTTGLFIINYEQLIRDLDVIRDWKPDLVVLDEAQRIKNWATKTALSVKGLSPPYRLVLTGTPMENRVEELASVVEWVDDLAMEPKWRLNAVHAVRADGRREIIGVRHLDTLRTRLQPCMVRRVRQDVLDQLPPRTDTRVPVAMTEPQLEEHDSLNQPIAQIVQKSLRRPLTQAEFLRLMSLLTTQRIISNGLCQLRFEEVWPAIRSCRPEESMILGLAAPKLLELRQLVRQIVLEQGRKAVIFSQWRRMLTLAHWAVGDLLAEEGLHAGAFTGAEKSRRRTQNIVEFHDDPRFRLLFASDAGGVGLNLQRAANCVINLELPWNPAVLEQRIGRVYRIGQDQPIDVFNLVSEPGIESRIASLVGSKQAFFKGLFDGDSDAIQFEQSSSFLSRVQTLYEVERPTTATEPVGDDGDELLLEGEFDDEIDDSVSDAFEPILDAADESQDQMVAADEPQNQTDATTTPEPAEAIVSDAEPTRSAALPTTGEVRQLFSRLQVHRADDGKVLIEAPAEAASTLGALFEGMAALLRSLNEPDNGEVP